MALTALDRFSDDDLNPDEVIIYRTRIDLVAFFIRSVPSLVIVILGIAILLFAIRYQVNIGFLSDSFVTLGVLLGAALLFIPGAYRLFHHFLDWFYDESIVTNQRVVSNNQDTLFSEQFVTANIRSVEELSVNQNGFLQTIFDFGTVMIRTAAKADGHQIVFVDIPKPKNVQRLIDEIGNRVKKEVRVNKDEVLKVCGL